MAEAAACELSAVPRLCCLSTLCFDLQTCNLAADDASLKLARVRFAGDVLNALPPSVLAPLRRHHCGDVEKKRRPSLADLRIPLKPTLTTQAYSAHPSLLCQRLRQLRSTYGRAECD
jgi:hypothetical protein